MIQKLYEQGIVKFPTNILLRIYFAVFLMNQMRSKQHALGEVLDAENFKCSIDESYTLYFIKSVIFFILCFFIFLKKKKLFIYILINKIINL